MKAKPSKRPGAVVLELNQRDEPMLASASLRPFQIRRILVPIDFSECATKALRYAVPMAAQHGATLVLLYVLPTPPDGFRDAAIDFESAVAGMCAGAKNALVNLAKTEIGDRVGSEVAVRNGSPRVEITDFARGLPADLIVISTHGYTGIKHFLLGSVAEHVIRHAPCPVLIVREREREFLAP